MPNTTAPTPERPDNATVAQTAPPAVPNSADGVGIAVRYELLDEIARGGMGVVYRARDRVLDREVGVKTFAVAPAADSDAARRFREEARITGQLQHPNVPPVHDLGALPDGRPFLAMKLIRGRTLDALLKERPKSEHDLGRFVAIFEQIAQGVAAAHAQGIIHRDLKPLNVMVGAFGEVQVMDWGLAKELGARDGAPGADDTRVTVPGGATTAGSVFGTPAYMPPEQARGETDRIDAQSDVFSLGGVLCAILTGAPPYVGTGANDTHRLAVAAHLGDALARLDACGAEPELVALCKKCLAPERADRPADAGAVARAVGELRAEAERRARQAEQERAAAEAQAVEQRKRRKVQVALVAVLALLVAGGAALALWRERETADRKLAEERERSERQRIETEGRAEAARIEGERKAAEARAGAAERERVRVEALNAIIESLEYGRTIQVAHQEWREGNIAKARALMAGTKPELRGWEYHYLHRLCNGELLSFQPHASVLHWAAYNSTGTQIVTAGFGKTGSVRVWDAKSGAERLTLKTQEAMRSVSFSPDDTRIVGLSHLNRTVRVWDAKTGDELVVLKGVNGVFHPETFAVYSPDGARIVTGSWDRTARVFDAKTGAALFPLKGHTKEVRDAAFNADGTRLATASWDGTVRVWDAKTGAGLLTLTAHVGGANQVVFTPDGARIITSGGEGGADTAVRVWNAETGKELFAIRAHYGSAWHLSCSKDGTRFVTGGSDKTVRVWDVKTGAGLLTLTGHTGDVRSAVFSPDGARILTASDDRTVKVWDAHTGAEYRPVPVAGTVHPAFFNSDGSRFLAPSLDDRVKVCDALTGRTIFSLDGHATRRPGDFFGTVELDSASYTKDGTRIVTAGGDKTARVWDAKTGTELAVLKHTAKVHSASGDADGSRVVTTTDFKTVTVWETKAGTELLTFSPTAKDPKDTPALLAAVFTPDGERIVTVGRHVRVWDAKTGAEVLVVEQRTASFVRWVSFSPDGKQMITAGDDDSPKLWDVATGKLLLTLKGHTGGVKTAHFHPNGQRIVTASWDTTARVWDAKTGAELLTLKVLREGVLSAAFSPGDGTRLITAGGLNGRIKIWEARPVSDSVRERDARENAPK